MRGGRRHTVGGGQQTVTVTMVMLCCWVDTVLRVDGVRNQTLLDETAAIVHGSRGEGHWGLGNGCRHVGHITATGRYGGFRGGARAGLCVSPVIVHRLLHHCRV